MLGCGMIGSRFLRRKIIESLPDKTMSDTFKHKHKKLLMNFSLFIFLRETRFYIPSSDEADKNLPLSTGELKV